MLRTALRNAARAAKRAANSGIAGAAYAATRQAASTLAKASTAGEISAAAFAAGAFTFAATSSVAFASPRQEQSFVMVKPDGVNRGLVGEIISRFERKGYKVVGLKVLVPSADLAKLHYAEHDGKPFFPKLVNFLSSGPVVAVVIQGKGAVSTGRAMLGVTNPLASPPGTIRGDFGLDLGRNIVHASDSVESAQREIALWFKPEEVANFDKIIDEWVYE